MPGKKALHVKLRVFQTVLFIVLTFGVGYFVYYFPNVPPFLRHIVVKHRVHLHDSGDKKTDEQFLAWFNRDPDRLIPEDPNIIVSPADGFIAAAGLVDGKHHVLIEMRYTDVHVQRVPMDGVVVTVAGEGKPLSRGLTIGDYTLEKMAPYQKWTILRTEIGEIVVRQITSFFANRIEVFVHEGQKVKRGQRLGRVLAGSNVVLEMPMNVQVLVHVGQEVLGGQTIIARY